MVRLLWVLMVGLSVAFVGCDKKQEPAKVNSSDVQQKAADTVNTATEYAKQEKDEYVRKIQNEMDELKVETDKLKAKAQTANAKTKVQLDSAIKALEQKQIAAEKKFDELKAASADVWQNLKAGVDNAVDDLKQFFAKTRKESA